MNIEWNEVTRFSQVIAIALFVATFVLGFWLGMHADEALEDETRVTVEIPIGDTGGNFIACTQEAKLCSDGSSVSRVGPSCAFAPCPGEESDSSPDGGASDKFPPIDPGQIACPLDAKICPDGSSVGRVAPTCEFAPCPPGEGELLPDQLLEQ